MEKDCGSQLHQHYSPLKSPDLNSTSTVPYLGQKKFFQPFSSPNTCMVSANGSLPATAVARLTQLKIFQEDEKRHLRKFQLLAKPDACLVSASETLTSFGAPELSHSKIPHRIEESKGFYCLPYHHESANPDTKTVLKESLSTHKCGKEATSNIIPRSFQRQFLVFDQSGNRTNLIFSSLIASPSQNLGQVNAPLEAYRSQKNELEAKRDAQPWPLTYDEPAESEKHNEESEMQEDTEELDALLYSDDSECDDEETSTAHSPSENTGTYQNQEENEESSDEVTSPIDVSKRKRLGDEEDEQSFFMDTVRSLNSWECEDDAESSCVNGRTPWSSRSSEANKRLKRERVWDTLNILQSIIPGEKGKDTARILDESIQYLRFLKQKAKALGVAIE